MQSFMRKPHGFYLHVTCYVKSLEYKYRDNKGKVKQRLIEHFGKPVACDFGVKKKLALSSGIAVDFEIEETTRLKKLQRKLARSKKCSRNRRKVRHLLRAEYQKLTNRRQDCQNRIIGF